MASEANLVREPGLKAAADYSAASNQFRGVVITAANTVTLSTTAGERIDGILYNKPKLGEAAEVVVGGTVKAKAGGAVSAGDIVAVDTNGDFVTSTPAVANQDKPVGVAKTAAGAAAEIFSVILHLQAPVNEAVS